MANQANRGRKLSIFEHIPIDPYFYLSSAADNEDIAEEEEDEDTRQLDDNKNSDDSDSPSNNLSNKDKHKKNLKKKDKESLKALRFHLGSNNLMNQNVDERDEYELSDDEVGLSLLPPAYTTNNNSSSSNIEKSQSTNESQESSTLKSELVDHNFLTIPSEHYYPNSYNTKSNGGSSFKPSVLKHVINRNGSTSESPPKKRSGKHKRKSKFSKLADHRPKDVFVELVELKTIIEDEDYDIKSYEWKEISRWIKYEQDIDDETDMWSNPFVGALLYQSLLYLKTGLQYGTVLLDIESDTFESIVDEMIQDFIDSGHMNKENRDQFKGVLFSKYIHNQSYNTLSNFRRRQSILNVDKMSDSRPHVALHNHILRSSNELPVNHIEVNMEKKIPRHDSYVKFQPTDHNQVEHLPSVTPLKHRRSTLAMIQTLTSSVIHPLKTNKSELNLKGVADDAEACLMLIGIVDFLDRPVMGFIRLQTPQLLDDDLVEVQLKLRFLFVLLGPKNAEIDYVEIGRCMGTLMTNKDFHEKVYRATDRRELIDSITKFTNKSLCLVIPHGEYDKDLLQPVIDWMQVHMKKKRRRASVKHVHKDPSFVNRIRNDKGEIYDTKSYLSDTKDLDDNDPFKRTGCLFGGLWKEIKNRYKKYPSDIRDGFNLNCFISFIFVFTVCFAPALTFGGILADKTSHWLGVNEMLIATSLNGLVFGLFSGQPMMIIGSTGPFLLFEEILYLFCKVKLCIEFFLPIRCWIGLWVLLYTLIMVAFEGVFIIHYVTRFAEEIFAFLIACVFLADALKRVVKFFTYDPILKSTDYCSQLHSHVSIGHNNNYSSSSLNVTKTMYNCLINDEKFNGSKVNHNPEPNVALVSLVLFLSTFAVAFGLKKIRKSTFFGSYLRRTVSDVGILISILTMVSIDHFIKTQTGIETEKLDIPDSIVPTKSFRSTWFVWPLGETTNLPIWIPLACALPAFFIFIVLFLEVELTGVMLNAEHRKLKKGTGFNIDLLLSAILMSFNGFFGLPWMCAAPVRTLAHWASLCVYSKTHVPGEKPILSNIREQRVTNISVHLAIGLCLLAKDYLKKIPICVLFGIFLYFGVVSLSGTQLFERIKLFFKPSKYRPNVPYARGVRPLKRNIFTIIQIGGVIILLGLKSYTKLAFLFPIVLVALVPFRIFILPKIFNEKELEQLDQEHEDAVDTMSLDFYQLTHLPI